MSGGFSPGYKTTSYGVEGQASFLASEHMQVKRAGATVDSSLVSADADGNKILEAGTFLTPITASGKYGVHDPAALDGRETPNADTSGFLTESVNLKNGDVVVGIILHGSVLEARLPVAPPAAVTGAVAGRITFQ